MPVSGRLARVFKVVAAALIVLLVLLLGSGAYLYRLSATLPDVSVDSDSLGTAKTSVVYASDGSVLAEWHGEEDRTIVALEDIPEHVRNAVVAIEDERFHEHHGVDTRALLRALRADGSGERADGGSTITQQLVKILFADGDRTLRRKVREALLAYELEAKTDKDTVLETYLNTVYFGHGSYGVESAARRYFGVHASELDVAQAATLAAVIRAPGRYSPIDAPQAARERRDLVVSEMARQGYLNVAEKDQALATDLVLAPPQDIPDAAPYFVEYVKQELIERLGAETVFKGGLRVHTTLDPELQRQAEQSAFAILSGAGDPEVAVVAVEHDTGALVALVGGRDYATNQFDLAVQGHRQPGSAFKPFVLVTALEHGVRPDQVFSAAPYSVEVEDGTWTVQNYENQYAAESLTLRAATNWSVNCVYARLIMQVGADKVAETAREMGISTPIEAHPAIALGGLTTGVTPLEMASAYGTIASGGRRVAPSGIQKVTDDAGELVWEPDRTTTQAIPESVAMETSLMLHDVVENGTGLNARIPGVWVAGKTGTTQSYRDAWFVGWAEDLSCAVWVGYREGQVEMLDVHGIEVTGGSFPATIWRGFMQQATAHRRAALTPPPAGAGTTPDTSEPVLVSICSDSMELANANCPDVIEIYLDPALAPTTTCTRH